MSLKTEIRANTEQAQAAFKKFADALSEVEKQGKKTGQSFDDFGKTLNEIEKQGKKAGQSFDSFSNLLAQLKKQSNGNFTNLINELEKLGKTSGLTNEQLNKIFKGIKEQSTATSEQLGEIAKNTNTLTDKLAHSAQAINGWWDILKGTFGSAAQSFIQTADAINTMNARLKQVSSSEAHFQALKSSINEIARASYSSTESISNLFINLNQSLSEMGVSQKQALEMSETLAKALSAGGASAIDAERAITQFSQALSTGKLQGQDFKAMIQAAPSLLKNMADALGVTTGEIRQMATAGELTNEKLVEAFANMKDDVDAVFEAMPVSVENAMALMDNSIENFVENLNTAISATGSLSDSIVFWGDTLRDITPFVTAFINEVVGVFAEALLGLKGIWDSFVLAFADFVELVNSIPGLSGNMDVANWLNATRAEHDLSKVAAQIEAVREKTKNITIKIYDNANAKGDVEALNKTSAVAQTAIKNVEKEAKKARGSIKAADPLKELVNQLKAQESYYKSINDYASANAKTLQAYEIELSEQIKKQLITREQAEKLYQNKRVELEADTNEKILNDRLKTLQEEAEFFKITGQRGKELETYYKIADEQAKAYIKKWEVTDKNFIKNINNYFKSENSKSFKTMNESFNENISSMSNAWDNAVDGMAKSISDGLFDLITGKTESLSDAFSKIGKNILGAFVSPLAQSFSDGIGGIFKGLMGGGGSALSAFADDYGLKLENGVYSGTIDGNLVEILTDGSVKTGGSILSSVLGLSESTDNVLSAVSSLKSGVSILTNGITGLQSSILSTTYSPFGFASSLLNDFGATGLGSFVNDFGVGFSNITSFNGFGSGGLGAIFEGTIGQALGAAAGGASVGGLVGSLGDMLFGAKTQASTAGAIGGAIGTAIMPGIGTAIGSLLGSIAGSFFGEWEVTDTGMEISGPINLTATDGLFSAFDVMRYEDSEKKGWFSSDEKSESSFLDWNTYQSLNQTGKAIVRGLDGLNEHDVILAPGKISDDNPFGANMDLLLAQAVSNAISYVPAATYNEWRNAAGGENVTGYMMGEIAKINATIKTLESFENKSVLKKLENSVKQTQNAFNDLGADLGNEVIANIDAMKLSTEELAKMYEDGIKQNFTPENINAWNNLINAYDQAKQAQEAYTKALLEFKNNVYSSIIGIKSAFGQNTDILGINSLQAAFYSLTGKNGLGFEHIADFAERMANLDYNGMYAFLNSNYEDNSKMLEYATQYAQLGTNALENIKKSLEEYEAQIKQINEQILKLELEMKASELEATINLYNNQKKFIDKLKQIANSLRLEVYEQEQMVVYYEKVLAQAKADWAAGNYDSNALNDLAQASKAQAANIKNTAATAEQYRFEVLQMANEIEDIVPRDYIEAIVEGIDDANKQLAYIRKELETSNEDQLAALNAQKDALTDGFSAMLLQNADLFNQLGGEFRVGFLQLADKFSSLEEVQLRGFSQLADALREQMDMARSQASLADSLDVSWDAKSAAINQKYVKYLGRNADYEGLQFWYNEGNFSDLDFLNVAKNNDWESLTDEAWEVLNNANRYQSSYQPAQPTQQTINQVNNITQVITPSPVAQTPIVTNTLQMAQALGYRNLQDLINSTRFADGGIVTGPTKALIGEAGYPEAVIPLKDGAGLKVDMDGGFNALESRLARLELVLNKIATTNDETARTLRNVSDGEVLYIKGA